MFVFDIVDAYNNKTHYKLKTGEYTLGKGDNCDIILSDGHVSREHASLTVSTDKVVLADKASLPRPGVMDLGMPARPLK